MLLFAALINSCAVGSTEHRMRCSNLLEKLPVRCFNLHNLGKDCTDGHRLYTSCERGFIVQNNHQLKIAN